MRKAIVILVLVAIILGICFWYKSAAPEDSKSHKDRDSLAAENAPKTSLAHQMSNESNLTDAFDLFLDTKAGHFSSTSWFQMLKLLEANLGKVDQLVSDLLADESFDRRLLAYYLGLELFGFNDTLSEYALSQESVVFSVTAMNWLYRSMDFSAWKTFTEKFFEELDDRDRQEILSYLGRPSGERDLPASFSIIGLGFVEYAELLRVVRADQFLQTSLGDMLLREDVSPPLRNVGLELLKETGSADFKPTINHLIEGAADGSRSQRFLVLLRDRRIGYEPAELTLHQQEILAGNLEERQTLQSAEIILDAIRINPSTPIDASVLDRISDYLENLPVSTRASQLRLADIAYSRWISRDQ